jgi:hypothetical protein
MRHGEMRCQACDVQWRGFWLLEKSDSQLSLELGSCHLGERVGGVRDPGDARQHDSRCALGRHVYDRVSHQEIAHDVWLKLCNTYECSSKIKSSRKHTYNRQYPIAPLRGDRAERVCAVSAGVGRLGCCARPTVPGLRLKCWPSTLRGFSDFQFLFNILEIHINFKNA